MFFANNNSGKRIHAKQADKRNKYFCPICNARVKPKQGELNAWHFAHEAGVCPDTWHYDMSEWHSFMQNLFPYEFQEIVVSDGKKKHRADVLKDDIVIEFQHSSLPMQEYDDRNQFFMELGYRIVWVFDQTKVKKGHRFLPIESIWPRWRNQQYQWIRPLRMLEHTPEVSGTSQNFALWLCLGTERDPDDESIQFCEMLRINRADGIPGFYDFSVVEASDTCLTTNVISNVTDFFQVWELQPGLFGK